jgi:hypothetical protein
MDTAARRLGLRARTVALGYASDSAYVAGVLLAVGLVLTVVSLGVLQGVDATLAYCAERVCS